MRALLALSFSILLAPAAFAQTEEDAGDVSEVDKDRTGPLRERVRPVSGNLFLKRGRLEISPSLTASFNDPFFQKYLGGATLSFFPSEHLGVNLRFGMDLPSLMGRPAVAGSANICTVDPQTGQGTGCRPPAYADLDGQAPGQLTSIAGIDVQYAPIYGKVGIVAERFVHFDLYGLAGASMVAYRGPSGSGTGGEPMTTAGANLGLGVRIVLSRSLTLRTELRDLIYVERIQSASSSSLRNQLLFELGFSIFLPSIFSPE